jgi:CheY-like chemotaxis protein
MLAVAHPLNESNIALRRATTEAEKANESKSVFLSNMSHEIRTPMNGVLGTLQILERSELDEKSKELVSKAIYSASSLLTIINDILDFSKIEAHKLVLEQAPFSFGEVLESVKLDTIESVRCKGIELIINIDPCFHDGWMGDYVRVRQFLLNLISNAVKFTETGSVTVDVSRNDKNVIEIVVTDTGIGMSDEAQQRIFERFNQADSSTTRKYSGTGLGMPITVSLIRLMGGDISINSVVDQGTAVAISLPLEQAENLPKHKIHGNTAPSLDSKTILVAEDNEINQLIIKTMLEETNAKVIIVENGKIAVEAFKRYSFDLVLMDIQMPEMDGIEAFTVIQGINESIPVIALTANVMMEDVQKYNALGFVGHIGKPIDLVRFYEVLEDTLM